LGVPGICISVGKLAAAVFEPLDQAGARALLGRGEGVDVDDAVRVGVNAGLPGGEVALPLPADEHLVGSVPVVLIDARRAGGTTYNEQRPKYAKDNDDDEYDRHPGREVHAAQAAQGASQRLAAQLRLIAERARASTAPERQR